MNSGFFARWKQNNAINEVFFQQCVQMCYYFKEQNNINSIYLAACLQPYIILLITRLWLMQGKQGSHNIRTFPQQGHWES